MKTTSRPGRSALARPLAHRLQRRLAAAAIAVFATTPTYASDPGRDPGPTLHEPIPPDPAEDLAMHVVLPGNLPAAIRTPHGKVAAPDPQEPPSSSSSAYSGGDGDRFHPDRDTRRPTVSSYDDPFTPSTAPFKRLSAFDAVRADYTLGVRDERQVPLLAGAPAGPDDDSFYGDLVIDVAGGQRVRIPSVGPGARIVHARLGVGTEDLPFRVFRDGADNWFLEALGAPPGPGRRARLVMELAIPRGAFGGDFNDANWSELPLVPPLPENVAREAAVVRAAIGVSRHMRPRDAVTKLVQYFRSFADSDDPPRGRDSVYLDLALSKKGVCRHRAFAFLVTAQSLGIPSRLVLNEAHAWVEVHDGLLYRRIDLGGAGHMDPGTTADRATYDPPPDTFRWPAGSKRGDEMVADARTAAAGGSDGQRSQGNDGSGGRGATQPATAASASRAPLGAASSSTATFDSPSASGGSGATAGDAASSASRAVVRVDVLEASPHRGDPLRVRGTVSASGQPCDHVVVDVWLAASSDVPGARTSSGVPGARASSGVPSASRPMIRVGSLATDDRGVFEGAVTLPPDAPLGDYVVVATSSESSRCNDSDVP